MLQHPSKKTYYYCVRIDWKELLPNVDNNRYEFSYPGLEVKMVARERKKNKERFNFETLATNGLTAYNIYIFMTYLFILFNDTVNTTTSSQLWLSCGAVSLKFRIA